VHQSRGWIQTLLVNDQRGITDIKKIEIGAYQVPVPSGLNALPNGSLTPFDMSIVMILMDRQNLLRRVNDRDLLTPGMEN